MSSDSAEDELRQLRARVAELARAEQQAREAYAELERTQRMYRAAMASAPIGLGIADSEGELLLWNDAMLAVSGFFPGDVEAWKRSRASAAARASREQLLAVVRERGGLDAHAMRIPRTDGTTSDAVVTVRPVRIGDESLLHVTMQDVTELKRVERALRESELRFRQVAETMRESQKMDAIGQLAGGVAHDFNNLLTAILGNVALLQRKLPHDSDQRETLADVALAAARGADLTKKLLGFSRRTVLTLRPVDLRETVRETAALLGRTLDPRINLVIEEPAEELGPVLADAGEMSQVLLNLCLNSRDAMPDGGTLRLRTSSRVITEDDRQHWLDARPGEAICVTVEDTGLGIPPEAVGRIFEPFFTTKKPGAGTGLGLAMVFGIVKQHQGWVDFSTTVGVGTRFDVYLPRHDQPLLGVSIPPPLAPTVAKATILFVDDEAPLRRVANAILIDRGYHVLTAEDGVSALELFEHAWRTIDLVVLDLRMPRLSGRDTLQAILRVNPEARVLVSSGDVLDSQLVSGTGGIVGVLDKPYGYEQLARAVRAALDG